jgi:Transglycosylase-like domain
VGDSQRSVLVAALICTTTSRTTAARRNNRPARKPRPGARTRPRARRERIHLDHTHHRLYLCALTVLGCFLYGPIRPAQAHAWPVPPAYWRKQAACITWAESRNNPKAVGDGSYGLFQFELATWVSVGGMGSPTDASRSEQTYRAWLVYSRDGHSWREWSTARGCGLR